MNLDRVLRVVLLVTLAASALTSAGARADDARSPEAELDAELAKLGSPLAADAAKAVAHRARQLDAESAKKVVATVRSLGGHAAVLALGVLATHREADVREAALAAIAEIRVRVAEVLPDVRAAIQDDDASVRKAAYAAMGAIGDVADVPTLLEALRSTDQETMRSGFDALRELTGARLLYRERVWLQWWKETREAAVTRMPRALVRIEEGGQAADVDDARSYLVRCGWFDLLHVKDRVLVWLESSDARLRTEAYTLAAKLRLGDVAERVATALGFESEPSAFDAGVEAARILGVRSDAAAKRPSGTR